MAYIKETLTSNGRRAILRGASPPETEMIGEYIVNLSMEEIAYLAGIVDGEGTISVHKTHGNRKNTNAVPYVSISNTNEALIKWIRSRVGGILRTRKPCKSHYKIAYDLRFYYNRALDLITLIYPYLIVKRNQAHLLLTKYKECTPRNGKYTKKVLEAKHALVFEMRALNKR